MSRNTNLCFANTLFCARVKGGPAIYIITDHTNKASPRRQVNVEARECCNFIKEYKLPCRHVLKVARVKGWLSTPANKEAFFAYWCAPEYWVANYKEGYSGDQLTLPVQQIGKFRPDEDYEDEVDILLKPPGATRQKARRHRRKKRMPSRGEVGPKRTSRKKKKKARDAGNDDNEWTEGDDRSLEELLFGAHQQQIVGDPISEDDAPSVHPFEQPLETGPGTQDDQTFATAGHGDSGRRCISPKHLVDLNSDEELDFLNCNDGDDTTSESSEKDGNISLDDGDLQAFSSTGESPAKILSLLTPSVARTKPYIRKSGKQGGGRGPLPRVRMSLPRRPDPPQNSTLGVAHGQPADLPQTSHKTGDFRAECALQLPKPQLLSTKNSKTAGAPKATPSGRSADCC